MTLRMQHKVWLHLARDTDMKDTAQGGSDETVRAVQSDIFDRHSGGSFDVADGANEDLSLGDITSVKGVWLQTTAEVQIKINGSTTPFRLRKPNTAATAVAKFFMEADITAVNVINDTGAAITGDYVVWGLST